MATPRIFQLSRFEGAGTNMGAASPELCGNLRGRRRDRRHEEVAPPGHGSDQLLRIVVERTPDFQNALGQRIVGGRNIRPDGVDELRLGHQPPCSTR